MLTLSVDANLAPTLAALRAGLRLGEGAAADATLRRVVVGHPQLLGYSASAKLAPQLRFLRRAACASDPERLRELVERSVHIHTYIYARPTLARSLRLSDTISLEREPSSFENQIALPPALACFTIPLARSIPRARVPRAARPRRSA